MLTDFAKMYTSQMASIELLLLMINVIVHVMFAGAVAKDAGNLNKITQKTALVSGVTWAFATLVGGVFVATIYWLIHHSKLTRS